MILFLDDDPLRCKAFLAREPSATIVHTAEDCIAKLKSQAWDECHLDHDLSGQTYQDSSEANTGMAVVRWIVCACPDVRTFIVHSYNEKAAPLMVETLESAGYRVVRAPFCHGGLSLLDEPPCGRLDGTT